MPLCRSSPLPGYRSIIHKTCVCVIHMCTLYTCLCVWEREREGSGKGLLMEVCIMHQRSICSDPVMWFGARQAAWTSSERRPLSPAQHLLLLLLLLLSCGHLASSPPSHRVQTSPRAAGKVWQAACVWPPNHGRHDEMKSQPLVRRDCTGSPTLMPALPGQRQTRQRGETRGLLWWHLRQHEDSNQSLVLP